MKISAEMISEGLKEAFDCTVIGTPDSKPVIHRILFVEPGTTWMDDQVYLVEDASDIPLPPNTVSSLILIVGTAPEELLEHFDAAVVINSGATLFKVHNGLQDIFARYDLWEARIHSMLSSGSDVQAMIDVSTELFGNPLLLHDVNFKAVAFSNDIGVDPDLVPLLNSMRLPYLMRSAMDTSSALAGSIHVLPLLIQEKRGFCVNIVQQDMLKYRLILIEFKQALKSSDAVLLEYLAEITHLAIGFVPEYTPAEPGLADTLKLIMEGSLTKTESIVRKLEGYGWLPQHHYVSLRFHIDIRAHRDRTLRFIRERIASMLAETGVFELGESIVAIINLDLYRGSRDEFERILTLYLRDNFMKAGMSNIFSGLDDLRQYGAQADLALELGPQAFPYRELFHFDSIVKPLLLKSCTTALPATLVCSPELLALRAYDREHHAELYNTLYVYLKNHLNLAHTARELFIHRTTLSYRLERIQKICGIDMTNFDSQWYVLLSFELLKNE